MKKLLLLLLLPTTLLLAGCATPQEAYNEAQKGCTMTGYVLKQGMEDTTFFCVPVEKIRENKFYNCSENCDTAIDDNRDLTLQGASTETLACLKLCMGE